MTPTAPKQAAAAAPSTTGWLIATHVLLCLSALLSHLSHYPPHHSLFYWWLAPLDLICLLIATPLYLVAARAAAVLNLLITAMETIALFYLSVMSLATPMSLSAPTAVAAISASLVAARAPLGWAMARTAGARPLHGRGCS